METTIKKTVKGATMEALFENSSLINIRHFIATDLGKLSDYEPGNRYKYEILVRHAENEDANVLFEEARFKTEILKSKTTKI